MNWIQIMIPIIVAVILFIINYFREGTKQPVWYYRTEAIISKADKFSDDIEIFFKGQKVPKVSITRIGLINVGKKPIDEKDIKTSKNRINFVFDDDIQILREPRIIKKHRQSIQFKAGNTKAEVFLTFNLLDHNDGAVIEVLHTGDQDTKVNISEDLVISEVPKGISKRSYEYASTKSKWYNGVNILISVALLILLLWILVPAYLIEISQGNLIWWPLAISALLVFGALSLFIYHIREYMKGIPSIFNLET